MRAGELQEARDSRVAATCSSSSGLSDGTVSHKVTSRCDSARLLGVLEQVLAALGLLDRGGVGEQAVQVAELLQQLRRGLDPDARHARHVVGGVAGERQHVAHQLRPDPEARDHLGAVDRLLLHRVVHLDALADQLHQVLVGGDDDHLAARLRAASRA